MSIKSKIKYGYSIYTNTYNLEILEDIYPLELTKLFDNKEECLEKAIKDIKENYDYNNDYFIHIIPTHIKEIEIDDYMANSLIEMIEDLNEDYMIKKVGNTEEIKSLLYKYFNSKNDWCNIDVYPISLEIYKISKNEKIELIKQ